MQNVQNKKTKTNYLLVLGVLLVLLVCGCGVVGLRFIGAYFGMTSNLVYIPLWSSGSTGFHWVCSVENPMVVSFVKTVKMAKTTGADEKVGHVFVGLVPGSTTITCQSYLHFGTKTSAGDFRIYQAQVDKNLNVSITENNKIISRSFNTPQQQDVDTLDGITDDCTIRIAPAFESDNWHADVAYPWWLENDGKEISPIDNLDNCDYGEKYQLIYEPIVMDDFEHSLRVVSTIGGMGGGEKEYAIFFDEELVGKYMSDVGVSAVVVDRATETIKIQLLKKAGDIVLDSHGVVMFYNL